MIELPNLDHSRELRQKIITEKTAILEEKGANKIYVAVSRVYFDITKAYLAYNEVAKMVRSENPILEESTDSTIMFWCDSPCKVIEDNAEIEKDTNIIDAESDICDEDSANQDSFRNILSFIEENYADCNITAERVAEFAKLNKIYLSRLFKLRMNMTYMDYLTGLRMKKVELLLLQTDKSIVEICHDVGYIDVSSFRRKFKKIYGVSVSEYRNMKRQAGVNSKE